MQNNVKYVFTHFVKYVTLDRSSTPTNLISKFVSAFKKFTNKEADANLWQRGFHDHIIRNEEDLYYHIQYINENPKKWIMGKDEYYA